MIGRKGAPAPQSGMGETHEQMSLLRSQTNSIACQAAYHGLKLQSISIFLEEII